MSINTHTCAYSIAMQYNKWYLFQLQEKFAYRRNKMCCQRLQCKNSFRIPWSHATNRQTLLNRRTVMLCSVIRHLNTHTVASRLGWPLQPRQPVDLSVMDGGQNMKMVEWMEVADRERERERERERDQMRCSCYWLTLNLLMQPIRIEMDTWWIRTHRRIVGKLMLPQAEEKSEVPTKWRKKA